MTRALTADGPAHPARFDFTSPWSLGRRSRCGLRRAGTPGLPPLSRTRSRPSSPRSARRASRSRSFFVPESPVSPIVGPSLHPRRAPRLRRCTPADGSKRPASTRRICRKQCFWSARSLLLPTTSSRSTQDLPDAASLPFWLRTSFKPRPKVPVSALRHGNVVVAGVMTPSELAATERAFANLKP